MSSEDAPIISRVAAEASQGLADECCNLRFQFRRRRHHQICSPFFATVARRNVAQRLPDLVLVWWREPSRNLIEQLSTNHEDWLLNLDRSLPHRL
jgi:ABC-type Fe2+-enterobactin transport system substrate-binding protein